nr:MAG TPA: hypothetical protein [Bacteriophage sp.]
MCQVHRVRQPDKLACHAGPLLVIAAPDRDGYFLYAVELTVDYSPTV